jgi:glucose/arabinose dehydrogenase/cytochrome c2
MPEEAVISLRLVALSLGLLGTISTASMAQDTRVSPGAQTYWVEEVVTGLSYPSAITWLPNGDALISERNGGLRILRKGKLDPQTVEGTPPVYQHLFNGLRDVVLDPDFATNRTLYFNVAEGTYDQYHTAVFSARYERAYRLTEVKRIFRAKDDYSGIANGVGRMIMRHDKTLLVAVPENNYYKDQAQRLDSHIGKILRINRDGTIPADNPFVDKAGALGEIWTYGNRVTTGLYEDPETRQIWEVEPGPAGGDELNRLEAGGNYGWAQVTWGFDYSGSLATPKQTAAGVQDPVLVWMRSPRGTPAGLTRYRGRTYPQWDGDFFVGHLAGRTLERLRIDGAEVVLRERILLDLKERLRDVKVGPDNHLYLLTDHQNGRLLRLQPGKVAAGQTNRVALALESPPFKPDELLGAVSAGDPEKGRQDFIAQCSSCHRVGGQVRGGEIGPDLLTVYGRKAGSLDGFGYSSALAQSSQIWDGISINMFIADPDRYLPGTRMASVPVTDAQMRRDVVGFLKQAAGMDGAF